MIFVTVGVGAEYRFDRLLHAVDALPGDEELVVQHGPSPVRPRRARCVEYLSFDETVALVRDARVVVTHAGAGSVLVALTNGRRPVVVPRLRRLGEAVDDHQVPFAERLAEAGLVTLVHDAAELPAAVGSAEETRAQLAENGSLVEELREYLRATIDRVEAAPTRSR